MYCRECGSLINENDRFCSNCGKENYIEAKEIIVTPKEKHVPKCFDVFAIVGFVVGLIVTIGWFLGIYGFFIGIYGIVFSALGTRSIKNHGKATAGLVLSIVGTILGLIFYISCINCMIEGQVY